MNKLKILFPGLIAAAMIGACQSGTKPSEDDAAVREVVLTAPNGKATAAFASGCFWCTEHIFESVVGVDSAISGYAGGTVPNPTYELVNTETTGHAETVLVYYDPDVVSFKELVKVFFMSHDPTTANRQGPDVGSSYRSILFFQTPAEEQIANEAIREFSGSFENPIVTGVKKLEAFYRAEGYHQDYIEHNPNTPYVKQVSIPRFEKFRQAYDGKLKADK